MSNLVQNSPKMHNSRDCIISISFLNETRTLLIHIKERLLAEDICFAAAQHCSISPVCRHLFALQSRDGLFLHPGAEFWPTTTQSLIHYVFRLRFRVEDPKTLQLIDQQAFNYLFFQTRSDFLNGKTLDLSKLSDSSIGMVVTDMVRISMELNCSLEAVQKNVKNYLPKVVIKQLSKLKEPVRDAFNRAKNNANGNVKFVKEEYIKQVSRLDHDYGCENFNVIVETENKYEEAIVQFNPFHEKCAGLIAFFPNNSCKMISALAFVPSQDVSDAFEELSDYLPNVLQPVLDYFEDNYIDRPDRRGVRRNHMFAMELWNMHDRVRDSNARTINCVEAWHRAIQYLIGEIPHVVCTIDELCHICINDCRVEINRRNGIPQYYIFHEKKVVYSFVSLLDGYYRLSCKWIFNLCKDLPTPSLVLLKNLKCHGPVTNDFSYAKLKKKGHRGSYILRESARNYDEYKLDLCLDTESPPVTFIISKNDSSEYYIKGKETIFQNVAVLRSHYHKHPILEDICLKTCIPPSEYDEMDIMLCRSSENINQQIKVSTTTKNKYKPKCIPFNAVRYPSSSKYVCKGRISINSLAFLNHESEKPIPAFTKSLLDFADFKLQDFLGYIETAMHWHCESIVSCIGLVVKTSTLITEYFPLGSLDLFLQNAGSELQEVDLVEAASYLARALCMHWIPREYHDNLSLAEHTLSTDVWAFGTTLWEIFSYGQKPSSTKITKSDYRRGITLTKPENCNPNIIRLIGECWLKDPDDRKKPQAIMRDIQQTLYGVYNSRRSHLYSSMIPESFSSISINGTDSSLPPEPPPKPPTLISQKRNRSSLLKFAFDKLSRDNHDETTNLSKSGSIRGSMTSLSSSTYNESVITDITTISNTDDNSSINGSYGDICISSRNVLKDVNEAKWLLDNNHITLGTRLGQGFYGEVYMANLLLWNGLEDEVVAVKKLKDVSESAETKEQATRDLYDEIRIMKFLHHKNIVKIIGYTIEPELWLVMEYLPQGSLLNFVKQHKNELELKALVNFAMELAEGMDYLGTMKIVHRDLAARNVLVGDNNIVKISDFGLAKAFVDKTYYSCNGTKCLPIRWYSLESIRFGKYSTKSDVWSYGITLWEIFSYGEEPIFETANNADFICKLEQGVRLPKPDSCPLVIYNLLRNCWNTDPDERITFRKVIEYLGETLIFN
ncbi:Megakaryocyte-associated tyrosine-protein kinase [Nymphon striatum]|nr:Megakaryocyte-associated tyrosine-protein kinase [Nymphon striatum]